MLLKRRQFTRQLKNKKVERELIDHTQLQSFIESNLEYFEKLRFDCGKMDDRERIAARVELYQSEPDLISAFMKKHVQYFQVCNNKHVDQLIFLTDHIITQFLTREEKNVSY